MEELQGQAISAVISIVGAFLAWAAVSVRNYFKEKIENEYAQNLLLRLTDAVEVGVRNASATLVPKIKAAAEDGKLTAQEAESLRDFAKGVALDQLTKVDLKKLEEFFDKRHLENKLDKLIEAAVQRLKEGQPNV